MGNRSSQAMAGAVKSSDPDVPNTPDDHTYLESRDIMAPRNLDEKSAASSAAQLDQLLLPLSLNINDLMSSKDNDVKVEDSRQPPTPIKLPPQPLSGLDTKVVTATSKD